MSPIAGIVTFGGRTAESREEDRLLALARRWSSRPVASRLGHALFVHSDAGALERRHDTLIASDSRLDNVDELATPACPASETQLIRECFELHGERGVARLLGAFAFAHWDQRAQQLTLARDCMGRRPLFFHQGNDFVAFASHLPDLLSLPEVPRRLDEKMLANFLALDHFETTRTLYEGIDRVPTRTLIRISSSEKRVSVYWQPNLDAPPPFHHIEDYIEQARALFDRAVERAMRDTPRASMLLSGGLDSSAVAATAARRGFANIACYTGVPPAGFQASDNPARYLDETPKIEALARMYPGLSIQFVAPDAAKNIHAVATRFFLDYSIPNRNASDMAWFDTILRTIASDGHRIALVGTFGNYTLSWDGAFSLTALAGAGRLAALVGEARAIARRERRALWRVFGSELILRAAPKGLQQAIAKLRGQDPYDVAHISLLNPDAIEALGLHEHWRRDGFDPLYGMYGRSAAYRAHLIFDHLQLSRDIAAMSPDAGGMERRDPFADRDLIEFCLAVPEWLYRRHGIRRWFAREVFADRLPPEILHETRRGEQAPDWFAALDANKSEVAAEIERIEASSLASRLIDVPRMKSLVAAWPRDANEAKARELEYRCALARAVHAGKYIRWVEGGNA